MAKERRNGFTLIELMVATAMGLILISLVLSASIAGKKILALDFDRTKVNQNLRSAIEMIGIDMVLAGENLGYSFPTLEVIDGGTDPDQIVLRRALIPESLTVCNAITAGDIAEDILFAIDDGTVDTGVNSASCVYDDSGQLQNYNTWRSFRTANPDAQVFIYDVTTGLSEFFPFVGEGQSAKSYYITRNSSAWTNSYNYIASSMFIIEEHRYRIVDDTLQLIVNQDFNNPLTIADEIQSMNYTITFNDGAQADSFDPKTAAYNWTDIRSIQIDLSSTDTYENSLSSVFFPRNILSN